MANNLHHLKARLKSIRSTQKITKAMRLVAISKLQGVKNQFQKNKEYADELYKLFSSVVSQCEHVDHPLLTFRQDTNPVTIILSSDMGMAGGYHSELMKALKINHNQFMKYYWFGQKGFDKLIEQGFVIINEKTSSDHLKYEDLKEVTVQLFKKYLSGEITSIKLIHASYINATSYKVETKQLLPIAYQKIEQHIDLIFDPSAPALLGPLAEKVLLSTLFNAYLEAKTCEYSARRMAMENASDNAQEIIDFCQLEYNKIRQASITQEITEIISATLGG